LLSEIEVAIPAAQETVEEARARMLDPRQAVVGKARAAVAEAALLVERLQAALPPLQKRYSEVYDAEEVAAWRAKAEPLRAERDELAAALQDLYRPFCEAVVPILHAIENLDVRIRTLNSSSPDGHLGCTEESVRGQCRATDLTVTRDLKLPCWGPSASPLWPPFRGIDPALITPLVDQRAFSDEWWRRAAG
jgi:hypothetical protein